MAMRQHVGLRVVQGEDPAQLRVEQLPEAWGERQHPQGISPGWEELAQACAAQVLQGGGRRHRSDEFHAALGCCAACHWEHALVLQLSCSYTWNTHTQKKRIPIEVCILKHTVRMGMIN